LALPVFGIVGTAVGIAGGIWNFTGHMKKGEAEEKIIKMIKDLVQDDLSLQEDIRHEVDNFLNLDDTEKHIVGEQIFVIMKMYGAFALGYGPLRAMQGLTACMIPLAGFFTGIPTVMAFLGLAAQGVQETLSSGAKEMADETIRTAVENAAKRLPNNWTKKFIVENAYGVISSNSAGKTVVKLTKEGAQQFADDVAIAVAAEATKWAKIVGGVTIGLGAIGCVWDVYQISSSWKGSRSGAQTKLGVALRRIASELEMRRSTNSRG